MELITLIIGVIVCGVGILLVFRLVTFILRIISVALLLVAILAVAGSYFCAQAYILPPASTAYLTLTGDGGFVIVQKSVSQYELDSGATAAFAREFIKPINELNTSSYKSLKKFANSDFFATIDTVWIINAIKITQCSQERVISQPKSFATLCFDSNNTGIVTAKESQGILNEIKSLFSISALNRVPVKASFIEWFNNYYFS